jgi:leucyl-tRNA synthetase
MKEYDHNKIEKKWQKEWSDSGVYKTLDSKKAKAKKLKPFYVLDMFPYPSGSGLHVGHPRGYIGSDVYSRVKRMQGFNVLHPMGYDAFGLPAEQYAIEHKVHPRKAVEINVKTFEKQLSIIGLSYDWSRRVNTTDPEYYRWTQWIFLQLFNSYYDTKKNKAESIESLVKTFEKSGNTKVNAHHTCKIVFTAKEWKSFDDLKKQEMLMNYRLAYESDSEVNWCEGLGTVLANDEIVDGKDGKQVSERGGFPVEKMTIRQWSMRITAYADRLLSGLASLDWAPHIKEIQKNWIGKDGDTFLIRDAIFARQRYWGEPIPLKRDKNGIITAVKKLPLELPKVTSYEPTGKAEGPLAGVKAWVKDGYETNTMPGWAGSSWYFLRYMDPKNNKNLVGEGEVDYWKNVDVYVGGAEHATGHLLYARFWHKFLKDIGVVKTEEPFKRMKNQGMILASDNRKMSKRWGNVINPDEIVKTYGADTLRVYEMFMGPFDQSLPWNTESIIGSRRFLERVWRLSTRVATQKKQNLRALPASGLRHDSDFSSSVSLEKVLHKTIKKVNEDIENFAFNTAISAMMIFVNEAEKYENISVSDFKMFLQVLAPFAPHMTDELWHQMGDKKSIHISGWPKYNPKKIIEDTVVIAVQINGKVRAEINISPDSSEDELKDLVMKNEIVLGWINGMDIKRFIYVKGRLVNLVV